MWREVTRDRGVTRATTDDARAMRGAFRRAFAGPPDPLAAYERPLGRVTADPFDLYLVSKSDASVPAGGRVVIHRWREYMATAGRHPACPHEGHVVGFLAWRREETPDTVAEDGRRTLEPLHDAYRFWQREPSLPHDDAYDPFARARADIGTHENGGVPVE